MEVSGEVFVVDGVRTPFGKAGGQLSGVRPDDLAAAAIAELVRRNPTVVPGEIEDVFWGATNQSGEDSRNVARTAAVLAGLPQEVAGASVNRLCGSGLEATASGARAIKADDLDLCIVGGSESMSRAPFVLPRADQAFPRTQEIFDSRLGWRMVNPRWRATYGAKTLLECAQETAEQYGVTRDEQDEYALRSHRLAAQAWSDGRYDDELVKTADLPTSSRRPPAIDRDETVRADASLERLRSLPALLGGETSVTAGNAAPMNDGSAATLLASEAAVHRYGLQPRARVVGATSVGVHPDGLDGPIPATRKLLQRLGWRIEDLDAIEMTEAFASQVVACIRELRLDPEIVNPWGGAIAIGHPLGASGVRLLNTLVTRLAGSGARRGIATMCIGVGQGISLAVEAC